MLYLLTGAAESVHDQREVFASTADYVIEALFVPALAAGAAALMLLALVLPAVSAQPVGPRPAAPC